MKKKLILFIALLLFPFIVNAKENCKVISGNGKDAGSEIQCGTEHFNILSSNDTETRMLAKYNLNVGETIKKIKIEKASGDNRTDEQYCSDLAASEGATVRSDVFYNAPGYCFISVPVNSTLFTVEKYVGTGVPSSRDLCLTELETYQQRNDFYYFFERLTFNNNNGYVTCYFRKIAKKLYQNENSISAHWDEDDNFLYPQVGDTYVVGSGMSSGTTWTNNSDTTQSDLTLIANSSNKYDGYFWDLSVREAGQFYYYLTAYSNSLSEYDIQNIDLITLDDINQLVKLNDKSLSYEDLYNASLTAQPPRYEFAFLQDYVKENHGFIYNTTYWVRTGFNNNFADDLGVEDVVFIDARGGICGSAVSRNSTSVYGGNCSYKIERELKSSVGTGIRPVVTILNADLYYPIKTETDGNGSIEVVDSSLGNEEIKFVVRSKEGYVLGELKVITDSGEVVTLTEGDLIENPDGTITIDKSKFTMPFESVSIVATFRSKNPLKNPETRDSIILILAVLLISGFITFMLYRKEKDLA